MSRLDIDQLEEKYRGQVRTYCRYQLKLYGRLLDHVDLDDYIQDFWVRVSTYYDHDLYAFSEEKSAITTWLIGISRSMAKEYVRHNNYQCRSGAKPPKREEGAPLEEGDRVSSPRGEGLVVEVQPELIMVELNGYLRPTAFKPKELKLMVQNSRVTTISLDQVLDEGRNDPDTSRREIPLEGFATDGEEVERRLMLEALRRSMGSLDKTSRVILRLRFEMDMSDSKITDVLTQTWAQEQPPGWDRWTTLGRASRLQHVRRVRIRALARLKEMLTIPQLQTPGDGKWTANLLSRPTAALGLSQRLCQDLTRGNVCCVKDLVRHTEKTLMQIPGVGMRALRDIKAALSAIGLDMGSSPEEAP